MLCPLVDLWSTSLTTRQSWCKHHSALAARSLFPTKGRLPVAFPSPSGDIPAVRGRCDCKSTKQNIIKRIWNVMCFYTLFNVSSAGFIAGRIVSCSCSYLPQASKRTSPTCYLTRAPPSIASFWNCISIKFSAELFLFSILPLLNSCGLPAKIPVLLGF